MTQDNKRNERISVTVKNKNILDILSRVAPIAGILIGSLFYGGGLVLTGTAATLTGWLASAGLGLVGGAIVSVVSTSFQKKSGKEEKAIIGEEQVIIFDVPAQSLHENGLEIKSYVRLSSAARSYCACTKSRWQKISHDMGVTGSLNTIPDDPSESVFAVFSVPAPSEEIKNDKGNIRKFLRGYAKSNSEERAKLYKRPLLDKHVMEYGFKI